MSRLSTSWKSHVVTVGALTGAKEYVIKHAEGGVDVLIFYGTEAGRNCGEVSTMVLILEVVRVMGAYPNEQILAAGGITTGR